MTKAGRELDALVAEKVMGGFVSDPDAMSATGEVWYWLHPRDGVLVGMPYKFKGMRQYDRQWHQWKPSVDIAAAWQVVERMNAMDYQPMAKFHFYLNDGEHTKRRIHFLDAATAAHIICLAALKAVSS